MSEITDGQLGKFTPFTDQYDPNLLFSINRDSKRSEIGIDVQDLPFKGIDIYNCYDFTWLNSKDLPEYGMLTLYIPCNSPNLIEAKSLKLYLFSFANSQFQSINEIISTLEIDLGKIIGTKIKVELASVLPDFMHVEPNFKGTSLDNLDAKCVDLNINSSLLDSDPQQVITEQLCSDLLSFKCPITNNPGWGSVRISYTGPKIVQADLLQYIVSYRTQQNLQVNCIERIYFDILNKCKPSKLLVEGRFTRRGIIDVNPVRSSDLYAQDNHRLFRQ